MNSVGRTRTVKGFAHILHAKLPVMAPPVSGVNMETEVSLRRGLRAISMVAHTETAALGPSDAE